MPPDRPVRGRHKDAARYQPWPNHRGPASQTKTVSSEDDTYFPVHVRQFSAQNVSRPVHASPPGETEYCRNWTGGNARAQYGHQYQYGARHITETHHHYHRSDDRSLGKSDIKSATGIAGEVLRSIAITSSGLQCYSRGVKAFRNARHAEKPILQLKRALELEGDIFLNSLELLLKDEADDELRDLLQAFDDRTKWANARMDACLRRSLGLSYAGFLRAVSAMEAQAQELKDALLIIDDDQLANLADQTSLRYTLQNLRFGLRMEAYQPFVDGIGELNAQIQGLAPSNQTLDTVRRAPKSTTFADDRSYAETLYAMLKRGFSASCTANHRVSLYLKPPERRSAARGGREGPSAGSRIILQHSSPDLVPDITWSIHEADVRPLEEQQHHGFVHASLKRRRVRFSSPTLSVTTSLVHSADAFNHSTVMHEHAEGIAEIDDLCHRFRLWRPKQAEIQCLGFLRDPSSQARHGVYWPENRVLDRTSATGKSLAVLLDPQAEQNLSLLEKRRLALAAALAMLRLHGTPWLGKQWGKHELVIFANAGKLVTTGAFISTVLDAQSGGCPRYFVPCRAIRNEAIFALGILLIELALDKPFEALKKPEDLEDGDPLGDFYTAVRVIEDVNRTAGFRYADVVRRCIRCDFDDSGTDLDDPAFQNKVFAGVVAELEEQVSFLEPPGSE